jgi:8-oxo-dGTP diphosphatase
MLPDVHVVAAVIERDGRILAARRLPGGEAGEKWEFPGGKVEIGETSEQALVREIYEELGFTIAVGMPIGTFVSAQEKCVLHLHCFWCSVEAGEPQLHAHSALRWCAAGELRGLDWASADVPAVDAILTFNT